MGEIYEDEKKEQVAENKGGWGLKMEEKQIRVIEVRFEVR